MKTHYFETWDEAKKKGIQLVEIDWYDITSYERKDKAKFDSEKDLKKLLTLCTSYGFIYKENKDVILLCNEVCPDEEDDKTELDIVAIPKKVIKWPIKVWKRDKPDKTCRKPRRRKTIIDYFLGR